MLYYHIMFNLAILPFLSYNDFNSYVTLCKIFFLDGINSHTHIGNDSFCTVN